VDWCISNQLADALVGAEVPHGNSAICATRQQHLCAASCMAWMYMYVAQTFLESLATHPHSCTLTAEECRAPAA
jgi:hypothetical protein